MSYSATIDLLEMKTNTKELSGGSLQPAGGKEKERWARLSFFELASASCVPDNKDDCGNELRCH